MSYCQGLMVDDARISRYDCASSHNFFYDPIIIKVNRQAAHRESYDV